MTSIALTDDHVLFRKGMKEIISDFSGFEVTIEANHGKELLEKLKNAQELPELVVLDINMPVMDGYICCAEIKKIYPATHVLALSMYNDEQAIIKMLKEGAGGYVLKDAHPNELKLAMENIMSKGFYHSDLVSATMINQLRSDTGTDEHQLNERELEFLSLSASELTYKEIADQMNLSPRTIDGYREALFEKFGTKSRVGLVLFGLKSGLITL